MEVSTRFNTFLSNLKLTDTQRSDGITKHTGVRSVLNSYYYGVLSGYNNSMLVGSWGKHTEIPEYENDWETLYHLAGKVLFAFFSSSHPPVDHVVMLDGLEGYPIDYLEEWACCHWAAQELCRQSATNSELSTLLPRLLKLSAQIDIKTMKGLGQTQRDEIDALMHVMASRYQAQI